MSGFTFGSNAGTTGGFGGGQAQTGGFSFGQKPATGFGAQAPAQPFGGFGANNQNSTNN